MGRCATTRSQPFARLLQPARIYVDQQHVRPKFAELARTGTADSAGCPGDDELAIRNALQPALPYGRVTEQGRASSNNHGWFAAARSRTFSLDRCTRRPHYRKVCLHSQ